jgi:hypothetical protein
MLFGAAFTAIAFVEDRKAGGYESCMWARAEVAKTKAVRRVV